VGPDDHLICALSGGVDSTVAATLGHRVLGDRLHCVFVDNGLLRLDERQRVEAIFKAHLHLPVTIIDASARTLAGTMSAPPTASALARASSISRWLPRLRAASMRRATC
jgi:GMP synthase PP-ATPase subunit